MSTTRSRMTAAVAVAAAVTLSLTACGGSKANKAAETTAPASTGPGAEIVAGAAYEATNYHPSSTTSALSLGTNWHVIEGLWNLDMSDYKPYKALSASDEPTKISDTEYEVKLRDGAKFSDGKEITSEDVVKSFERMMAKGNLYASLLNFIDGVSAKDAKTVTIKLKQPFSLLKQRLAIVRIVPAAMSDDDLKKMPIGSGPYKYEKIGDAEVIAVPNENYNGDMPAKSERLKWTVIKDDTARTTAAQAGTIQVMEAVPADNAKTLEAAGLKVEKKAGFNQAFMLFNTKKAPFNDARVRQAFHYAIDVDKLVANNMSGEATPATSFLPKDHPNYHKASTVYTKDTEKAKKLLAEAGVSNLSVTLLSTDHTWIKNLTPQIKNDLEAAGISVNLEAQASASLYSNNLDVDNPTFDLAIAPGDPSVFGNDPALLMNWWYGDNAWTNKRSGWKASDPANFEKLQGIINEAVALEGDAQQKKWDEAFDLIAAEAPIYPLFHRNILTASSTKLTGFTPISTTGMSLLNAKLEKTK